MKHAIGSVLLAALILAAGCVSPTVFRGDPKVRNGPQGCRTKCQAWGLEFAGMVAMGEYSTGCVCRDPDARAGDVLGAAPLAMGQAAASVATEHQRRESENQ